MKYQNRRQKDDFHITKKVFGRFLLTDFFFLLVVAVFLILVFNVSFIQLKNHNYAKNTKSQNRDLEHRKKFLT